MGNRLSRIYTRTGDDGSTGLGDGSRVGKDSARVEAYGTVDEANSCIGLLLASDMPETVRDLLIRIQHQLFDLVASCAFPAMRRFLMRISMRWKCNWTNSMRACRR